MKLAIETPEQLGLIIRASRKALKLRQDDAAGSIGVSENFLSKVERGGETVQWGKLFLVMRELGLNLTIDVPNAYAEEAWRALGKMQHACDRLEADAQDPSNESTD
jgi:transcriptional regulator with XRE-family HTH domain